VGKKRASLPCHNRMMTERDRMVAIEEMAFDDSAAGPHDEGGVARLFFLKMLVGA